MYFLQCLLAHNRCSVDSFLNEWPTGQMRFLFSAMGIVLVAIQIQ